MIIYFTGTGNSRFIAEGLAKRLEDEAVSANRYIKEGRTGAFISEKPFVFVFPVYLSTSPTIFRNFIKDSAFSGSKDAYFIATCAKEHGSSGNSFRDLCRIKEDLEYKGCVKVQMPQNYIPLFKMTEKEEQDREFEAAEGEMDKICEAVRAGEELDGAFAGGFEYAMTKLVEVIYNGVTITKPFRATDACIGCGACEKMCPTNTIRIKDGKPIWTKKRCTHCMACINRCPKEAIEFWNLAKGKERYRRNG